MGGNPDFEFTKKLFRLQSYILSHSEDRRELAQNSEGGREEVKLVSALLDPAFGVHLISSWLQSRLAKAWVFCPLSGLV